MHERIDHLGIDFSVRSWEAPSIAKKSEQSSERQLIGEVFTCYECAFRRCQRPSFVLMFEFNVNIDHGGDYRAEDAGTQRYSVGIETPKFRATSFGGTPVASNFLADSIRLPVIRRFRPPTRP